MEIDLQDIAKRFNRQWLYKGLSYRFANGSYTAVTGNNGSGKSTLIQVIYGYQSATKGVIAYRLDGKRIATENVHLHTSFVAPYLELPEELTLLELLHFHFRFKKLRPGYSVNDLVTLSLLQGSEHKYLKHFSSGMKQRVKLILAIFSEHRLLLLDEPCTNLDNQGIGWYREMMKKHNRDCTVIIASNQESEYDFCPGRLDLGAYQLSS